MLTIMKLDNIKKKRDTMGTDKHENDIKRKGRPAGRGKAGTNLTDAFAVHDIEQDNQITNRYLGDEGGSAEQSTKLKHPNRNPDKGTQD
jgi:hypothetical protein